MPTMDLDISRPPQDFARAKARLSARAVITPAILVRYSAEPRPSAAGDAIASAAGGRLGEARPCRARCRRRAFGRVLGEQRRCRRRWSAPIAQVAILPPETVRIDGGGGGRVVADLALQFFVGPAVPAGGASKRIAVEDFARLGRGVVGAMIVVARRDACVRRRPAQDDSSRPAPSSPPACRCRGRHWRHCRRSCPCSAPAGRRSASPSPSGSAPAAASGSLRDDLVLGRHRADDDFAALDGGRPSVRRSRRGRRDGSAGEPQLHHRNQAVAAGDDARVGVEAAEQARSLRSRSAGR